MANVVSKLKTALGAGARQSKYKINMSTPAQIQGNHGETINTLCNAQSFPGVTQGPINVYIQGRKLVLPGDTEYESTWSVTFYQTEAHELRKVFLAWMKAMDDFHNNKHQGDLAQLMVDAEVSQLDHDEKETITYLFKDLHPQSVSQVEVSDETQNEIQRFEVTFSYTSWQIAG